MEEVKKKRGRPRKNPLPETIQNKIQEVVQLQEKTEQEIETQEIHQIVENFKKPTINKGEWDVDKNMMYNGERIMYFDKTLSYEITGYKPITETEGLAFNPEWFTQAARTKTETGKYTNFHFGTKLYREFWHEEYRRCRDGYTVGGYTITGPHYFFLNYYQLKNSRVEKAGTSSVNIFPRFMSAQYEFFHYYELCRHLRKNVCIMKSRAVGFSEIISCLCTNIYSCYKNSVVIVTAFAKNQLDKTLEKVEANLEFLNDKTEGGFRKLRQVADSAYLKRASYYKIVDGQKIETGPMSQIEGIVADKPSKVRGDRAELVVYEEGGSNPVLSTSFIQGRALTEVGGNVKGILLVGGTGGDFKNMEGLEKIYTNPNDFKVLPFKHNYTMDGSTVYTGFFIPSYIALDILEYYDIKGNLVTGCVDNRGVCNIAKCRKFYEEERSKIQDAQTLMEYTAEYCFTAEEAFSLQGDNKFNKVFLNNQLAKIKIFKQGPKIQRGDLQFIYKSGSDRSLKNISGVKWIPDPKGPIRIIEKPLWEERITEIDEDGKEVVQSYSEMRNLYVAGIDSIDIGEEQTSDATKDPSKFCITIKKRAFGTGFPQYVAYYMDRPADERIAYQTALKMLMWYNCRANIEATRISMLSYAKRNGFGGYFMNRPRATYPDSVGKHKPTVGTPATQAIIGHQIDLIANFIEDSCDGIWFEEMLEQLNSYSDKNKKKFDIVAAMGMTELADEELTSIVPSQIESDASREWQDIGYYTDEYGYRRFGPIPQRTQPQTKFKMNTDNDDPRRVRTSNPRYNFENLP